jgi:hypothetical protein
VQLQGRLGRGFETETPSKTTTHLDLFDQPLDKFRDPGPSRPKY